MGLSELVSELVAVGARGPGTDAERRAARLLQDRLADAGREADLDPHWVRPHWPLVHLLHSGLAVAASLLALTRPWWAVGVLAVVLVSLVLDLSGRLFLLRRLTPERATQNVVALGAPPDEQRPVRLIVTAVYDAGRSGLVYAQALQTAGARLQQLARGRLPGPWAWFVLAVAALLAIAVARAAEVDAGWLAAVQLVPTVGLLLAFAAFADIALSPPTPGASDCASGVAVAMELVRELDATPPAHLTVELVLAGAGHGPALGFRGYVRYERRHSRPEEVAVLDIGPCGAGRPRWWEGEGPVVPVRLHPRLCELCAEAANAEPHLGAAAHRSHAASGAYRARLARWPAMRVGCLDERGVVPGAGRRADIPDRIDHQAMEATLEFCLALVDRLDADVGRRLGA